MPKLFSEVVPFLYAPRLLTLGGDNRNILFRLSHPQGASQYPRFYNDRWGNLQQKQFISSNSKSMAAETILCHYRYYREPCAGMSRFL